MTATVTYLGDLSTEATHLASKSTLITDAPVDNQGKGAAFSPTDLMATSLASCALTIMGIAARTHQINLINARAEVTKTMSSEPPRRVARIDVAFFIENCGAKERAILENAAKTCPVSLSLNCEIGLTFNYI